MNELEAERRMLEQAKPGNPDIVTVHRSTAGICAETVHHRCLDGRRGDAIDVDYVDYH